MCVLSFVFFFNDPATTEIYTLSLHDALPISVHGFSPALSAQRRHGEQRLLRRIEQHLLKNWSLLWGYALRLTGDRDRKSTRLNSSHMSISYAVFCLKKKTKKKTCTHTYSTTP